MAPVPHEDVAEGAVEQGVDQVRHTQVEDQEVGDCSHPQVTFMFSFRICSKRMNESERVREEMEIEMLPVTTDADFLHYHRKIMKISYTIFCKFSQSKKGIYFCSSEPEWITFYNNKGLI